MDAIALYIYKYVVKFALILGVVQVYMDNFSYARFTTIDTKFTQVLFF